MTKPNTAAQIEAANRQARVDRAIASIQRRAEALRDEEGYDSDRSIQSRKSGYSLLTEDEEPSLLFNKELCLGGNYDSYFANSDEESAEEATLAALDTQDLEQLIPVIQQELPHIQSLVLTDTKIKQIHAAIATLQSLKSLETRGTVLSNLEGLAATTSIESLKLQLGDEPLTANLLKPLASMPNLKKLDLTFAEAHPDLKQILAPLADLDLKELTLNFPEAYSLNDRGESDEELDVDHESTPLQEVDKHALESIASNKNLDRLRISGAKISSFPDNFSEMRTLRWLDLSGTDLSQLQYKQKMESVIAMDLSECKIERLPKFAQSAGIKKLDLSQNPLTSLAGIEKITALKRLNIYDLDEAGGALSKAALEPLAALDNLKRLKLVRCGIRELPDGFSHLKTRTMNLCDNPLSCIPAPLTKNPYIRNLALVGCGIREIPAGIEHASQLKRMDLDDNRIDTSNSRFAKINKFKLLELTFC